MIANWSRLSQFQECRRKSYNHDILRLASWREADALVVGGGVHVGIATLFSTKNLQRALEAAEHDIRSRLEGQLVLPEERPSIELQIEWTKRAVTEFADQYNEHDVQVLWPEVEFCVPMPNSTHHCWFVHRILHPHDPYATCADEACVHPHYFKGKTDAVVQWATKVWLFEHKTNSMMPDLFFKKFLLDAQPTGYIYGIWKTLGVKPEGFILNVIQKPNKRSKDQLQVGFAREPYFRSDEDLARFEREFVVLATDYENAMRLESEGVPACYMNTKACTNYSRQCYYMDFCQRHFVAAPDEFTTRPEDYVEAEYRKILNL